jgi:hypothetical protein
MQPVYFSALKAGTATVGATSGGVSGTAHVTVQRAETPTGGVIPAVDDVHLRVANDAGVRFDDFGDNSFRILWSGGGLNALHISDGSGTVYGEVTQTPNRSGTFYVTTTGGRGYFDNIFLCVAVNGTIPDDFRLHIGPTDISGRRFRFLATYPRLRIVPTRIRRSTSGSRRTIWSMVRRPGDRRQVPRIRSTSARTSAMTRTGSR